MNFGLSFELGNSKGQKGAAVQAGTMRTPDTGEVDLSLRIVGIIFETGGQSHKFSACQE